jgi:hypothetical protein
MRVTAPYLVIGFGVGHRYGDMEYAGANGSAVNTLCRRRAPTATDPRNLAVLEQDPVYSGQVVGAVMPKIVTIARLAVRNGFPH